MKIMKCDRCGKVFDPSEDAEHYSFNNDKYWRYDVYFNEHPYYPSEKIDLCLDCKKALYKWMIGVDVNEKK